MLELSTTRPHAALLIIGDEILSGRTQDRNIPFLAKELHQQGIQLDQVRIVSDKKDHIRHHLHELRTTCDFVITTGGLGSTHDDLTVQTIAETVQKPLIYMPEAWHMMTQHHGHDLDEIYKKMAYFPEGSRLISNTVTGAPGFSIENIHALAGVPSIMKSMFQSLKPHLPQGTPWHTYTLTCRDVSEALIGAELESIQASYPQVSIGSYPSYENTCPLQLVLKADAQEHALLEKALEACINLLKTHGETPQIHKA